MISTDTQVFKPDSSVQTRLKLLANNLESLDVIVFTKKNQRFEPQTLGKLKLWSTRSFSPLCYARGAIKIGKGLSRPNLVTAQDPFLAGWAGIKLSRFFKVKLELQIHTDLLSANFKKFNFRNRFYLWLAKKFLPQADLVRVVSERIRESLIKSKLVKENQIYVLPIFVQTPEVSPELKPIWQSQIKSEDKIILTVSRLTKEKQLHLAIQALAQIKDPQVKLVIIGTGPLKSQLQFLAQKLNLSERVIFVGELGPEELAKSYQLARVFLLTSAYEGYGLVLAEAALARLPIVSTDVGIAREVGAVIVPAEVVAIKQALEEQLTAPHKPEQPPMVKEEGYLTQIIEKWSA